MRHPLALPLTATLALLAACSPDSAGPRLLPSSVLSNAAGSSGSLASTAGVLSSAGRSATSGTGGLPSVQAGRSGSSGSAALPTSGRGAAGSGTAGAGPTSPTDCAAPPSTASPGGVTALNYINQLRVAAGAGCATYSQPIEDGANKHCAYYAANSADQMCIADVHSEVMSCMGFTGANFGTRAKAAGYTGSPAFEVMAFSNNPKSAIDQWVNSVWHRIPVVSPWVTELGYGAAARCDTIDFGRGKPLPDTTVVVFPYDGQTGLPTAFDGSREGPMPPIPASTGKWPSGPPISLWAKKATFTDHVLTKDGDTTPIATTWLAPDTVDAQFKNFLSDVVFMYPDAPLAAATKYRVHFKGTGASGAIDREWTFTTR